MVLTIPKSLETDIMNFVNINEIKDVNNFLTLCLRDGFNIIKYGTSPKDNFKKENKPLEIEKYESTEESNIKGLENVEKKRVGRPKKQQTVNKEIIKPVEKAEEPIKPKKKIQIIKE